jgi:hypothetical protein
VPTGIRGKYGDKKIASSLNDRYISFHKSITAFGENLGWKGNVQNVNLSSDTRFEGLVKALANTSPAEKSKWIEWFAWSIAESQQLPKALPPLSPAYMTYAKCLNLSFSLSDVPSEGHIQQFLIAALLSVHRARLNIEVRTHHPHAADKYDGTAGDIEEFRGDILLNAYEVTVRDDWKNRIPDLRAKMREYGLQKYVLIGGGVSGDERVYSPKSLLDESASWGFDLAVVDIHDFLRVFCAELSSAEFVRAINIAHSYLSSPKLCGRQDFIDSFCAVVDSWMDARS